MPVPADSSAARLPIPVVILGTKGRSGTGLLSALLRLHPDCAAPPPPLAREDWLLFHAGHLADFAESVAARVARLADAPPLDGFDDTLLAAAAGKATHVVTKSPSLVGIETGFRLFPRARFLVMIRNGPDSVESSLRSWPAHDDGTVDSLETFAHHWRDGARHLLGLMETHPGRLMSVRYEDLVEDRERRLRLVFDYLGLDPARYDFAAAATCPVYGSSTFGRRGGAVNYDPVAADTGFRPLERAAHWGAAEHRRFNVVAADMMRAFGYPLAST